MKWPQQIRSLVSSVKWRTWHDGGGGDSAGFGRGGTHDLVQLQLELGRGQDLVGVLHVAELVH